MMKDILQISVLSQSQPKDSVTMTASCHPTIQEFHHRYTHTHMLTKQRLQVVLIRIAIGAKLQTGAPWGDARWSQIQIPWDIKVVAWHCGVACCDVELIIFIGYASEVSPQWEQSCSVKPLSLSLLVFISVQGKCQQLTVVRPCPDGPMWMCLWHKDV